MQEKTGLNSWIESLITRSELEVQGKWRIVPLQGDASCRQYFRLVDSRTCWILVRSPLERIDNNVFVTIAGRWRQYGVNVPEVIQVDSAQGFMLLEDFGTQHLFDCSTQAVDLYYYRIAIEELYKIQKVPTSGLPVFDEAFLRRELNIFDTWFVKSFLKLDTPSFLSNVFDLLVESSLEQPQVTMHRDFHCRNLILIDGQMGVIDFQDAVIGPLAYDLASLLKDCYITHTEEQIKILMDEYLIALNNSKLLDKNIEEAQFRVWFDLIGLQRHLKVLGLFLRLAVEEGKSIYLSDLPRVFNYVLEVTAKYQKLHDFNSWLKKEALPLLDKKQWGRL